MPEYEVLVTETTTTRYRVYAGAAWAARDMVENGDTENLTKRIVDSSTEIESVEEVR